MQILFRIWTIHPLGPRVLCSVDFMDAYWDSAICFVRLTYWSITQCLSCSVVVFSRGYTEKKLKTFGNLSSRSFHIVFRFFPPLMQMNQNDLINRSVVFFFGSRVTCTTPGGTRVVQVKRWSPRGSRWNFLEPQTERGSSTKTGIITPTQETKNVWKRLGDQVSSLWWVLICPNQLMGLNQSTRLGTSSSWDSRLTIFVCRTESFLLMRWFVYY